MQKHALPQAHDLRQAELCISLERPRLAAFWPHNSALNTTVTCHLMIGIRASCASRNALLMPSAVSGSR